MSVFFAEAQDIKVPDLPPMPTEPKDLPKNDLAPKVNKAKTISRTQQFTVLGERADLRSAVATLVEDYKSEIVALLELEQQWKFPVVVVLHGKRGENSPENPIRRELKIDAGVVSFVLHLHCGQGIPTDALQRQIHEIVVYERALRKVDINAVSGKLLIPDWLSVGLSEAVNWKNGRVNRLKYAAMFRNSQKLEIRSLLENSKFKSLDAISASAFEASSGALVMCLLGQTEGKNSLKAMLDSTIQGDQNYEALLKRHFPSMALSQNSLAKWWALQTARLAESPLTESLTVDETEQKLKEVLTIQLGRDGETLHFDDFQNWEIFKKSPERFRGYLVSIQNKLLHLSYRCFPSYCPFLVEYMRLASCLLIDDIDSDSVQRLKNLMRERVELEKMGLRARDYMDWFEITQTHHTSGEFNQYMRMIDIFRKQTENDSSVFQKYMEDIDKLMNLPTSTK